MKKKINVLVTSVGGIGVGSQIVASLRITDLDLLIVGTDVSEFNVNKEKLDFFYRVTYANDDMYINQIQQIVLVNNINIIFPGCEEEYVFFMKNKILFEDLGIFLVINSEETSHVGFDKFLTYETLRKSGFPTPKYCKINSKEDYKNIDFFPAIIKPNRHSSSSNNIFLAFDSADAKAFIKYLYDLHIDIVAQEYIGDSFSEYTIGVSNDKNGDVLGTIIIKRRFESGISYKNCVNKDGKRYIISSGITQGEILHNNFLKEQAECVSKILLSRGPLNIQAMFTNDELMIIEVHPTLTGSVYIKSLAGYNEPLNIIRREILHEPVDYNYVNSIIRRSIISELFREEKDG